MSKTVNIKTGSSFFIEKNQNIKELLNILAELNYEHWLDKEKRILNIPQGYIGTISFDNTILNITPSIEYLTIADYLKLSFYTHNFEINDKELDFLENENLNESIINKFLETLIKLNSEGIPKKYVPKKKHSIYFIGNVDIKTTYLRNLLNLTPSVYTEIEELTTNYDIVQIIKCAYNKIKINYDNSIPLIDYMFQNVDKKCISKWELKNMQPFFGSHENTLMIVFELARKILLNMSFTKGDKKGSTNIILNANSLFENFTRDLLKKVLVKYNVRHPEKTRMTFPDKYGNVLESRPDILISEKPFLTIVDVKNKNFYDYFKTNDFYQIFTYCKRYNASKGILVYPFFKNTDCIKIIPSFDNSINLYAISINIKGKNTHDRIKNYLDFAKKIKEIVDF